jgi:hypothetical protein
MFDQCTEYPPDTRKQIVCSENKSKITFLNSGSFLVAKIKIDGCVIKDNNVRKCDYLVLCSNEKMAIFVELKGNHVADAIEQIEATLDNGSIKNNLLDYKPFFAYAVLIKRTPGFDTQIQQAMVRLAKKHCKLEVVNSNKEKDLQKILLEKK